MANGDRDPSCLLQRMIVSPLFLPMMWPPFSQPKSDTGIAEGPAKNGVKASSRQQRQDGELKASLGYIVKFPHYFPSK